MRVNVEADSLNAAVLGARRRAAAARTCKLFLADVVRDMTQKTGQKCTAIRRVLVPEDRLDDVREALRERLGDGGRSAIRRDDERHDGPARDARSSSPTCAPASRASPPRRRSSSAATARSPRSAAPAGKGYFVGPVLLEHASAIAVARRSTSTRCSARWRRCVALRRQRGGGAPPRAPRQGGLVSSVYSDDRDCWPRCVAGIAPWHGRLFLGCEKIADQSAGPGTVLPQLVHGGPGRAGGGEELGGPRGLALYMQRVALQGDRAVLDAITSKL